MLSSVEHEKRFITLRPVHLYYHCDHKVKQGYIWDLTSVLMFY